MRRWTRESILLRFASTHVNHRRIATGAAWTALFVLGAKVAAAGREVVVAWRYGVSGTVDAYQLAFTIATWLPQLVGAIATVVLVPRLVAVARDPAAYSTFVAELNGRGVLLGALVTLVTAVATVPVINVLSEGLGADTSATAVRMALLLAPAALFATLSGMLAARLQARQHYGYSFFEAMPAIGVIVFVMTWPGSAGGDALIWGTLAGFVLQAVALALMTQRHDGPIGPAHIRAVSPEWATLSGPVLLFGLGQIIMTATIPIDQAFASSLGEGGVATLGYASRVVGLLISLAQIVIARALLPVLAGVAADGDFGLGRRQTMKWSWLMLGMGTVTAFLGWVVAPLMVRVLFQRGAFSAGDTAAVAEALRYGLLQLAPFFAGIVLVQWLAVTGRHRAILMASIPAFLVKVALNAALIQALGVRGIMLATGVMYLVIFLMLSNAVRRGSLDRTPSSAG